MPSVAEIFDLWPTDADLGRDIGISYPTVSAWKQRGSIPASYWRDIVRAARRRGINQVTADLLAEIHARQDAEAPEAEPLAAPPVPAPQPTADGHFSRFAHLRRSRFASTEEIVDHVRALREEWDRR